MPGESGSGLVGEHHQGRTNTLLSVVKGPQCSERLTFQREAVIKLMSLFSYRRCPAR